MPPPQIKIIEPTNGGVNGGTKITIECEPDFEYDRRVFPTKFIQGVEVFIGDVKATYVTVLSEHIITAVTPANTSGPKDVIVINPDGSTDNLDNAFTYNQKPIITLIRPNNGKLGGGTKIEIMGSGFLSGASVRLGKGASFSSAASTQVVSDRLILAETPSITGYEGLIDIRVVNPDGQKTSRKDAFTYNPLPIIKKINPEYGSKLGGTILTIEGTGFLPGAKVFIGKRPATTEYKSSTKLEAVTPPNSLGTFDVSVVNPDGQETLVVGAFVSVAETVYNYPNPFRNSQGTTFRYVGNEEVREINIQVFNLNGEVVSLVKENGKSEVNWQNPNLGFGLYIYHMQVELGTGQTKFFKRFLQIH